MAGDGQAVLTPQVLRSDSFGLLPLPAARLFGSVTVMDRQSDDAESEGRS